ncbi:MAG: transglycosylase SLT domain-containing protein [Chloroflexi bacterium]|nr:transglycosylase SLT domain-containing protein [Chloroflexota bacterium]
MTKRLLFIFLSISILLGSCNSSPSGKVDPSPSGTPLPVQTAIPTPTLPPQAKIAVAENYLLAGDYEAAFQEFQNSSTGSTDPNVITDSLLGMGRVLLQKSDYTGAVNQFSSLLINYPSGESRDTAYFFLARAYDALSQPLLAADAYASYLSARPGVLDGEIYEMRGDALMLSGDPAAAKVAFELALPTLSTDRYDGLQIKIARAASASGDDAGAILILSNLYFSSSSNFIKAQVNLLLGQIYLGMNQPEQAYARFQDSVINFPEYMDSYSGLVALVDAEQGVNFRQRGIVDYYAGQYAVAITAFDQFFAEGTVHDGSAHYFKALSFYELGDYQHEIEEWDKLILGHADDDYYFPKAFVEKSQTLWTKFLDYQLAAKTCLTFVAQVPTSPKAPVLLDRAANLYEIGTYLSFAAETYERLFNEYPGVEEAYPALFKAGILYYRINDFLKAQITFQRLLVLATNAEDQAAANLWVGKSLEKQGKTSEALTYYQQAVNADPTGYYSIRAEQILSGKAPFPSLKDFDLAILFDTERVEADRWMRDTFKIDPSIDLGNPADLNSNPLYQRAEAHTKLDMREMARGEFESLRLELLGDSVNTYRLMNQLLDFGFYRSASFASRQVLDLAGVSETATLTSVPKYFNHIRFGVFFREIVAPTAAENDLDPLLIFSIIRQESLFDSSIISSVGAKGLMQIMPATGEETAKNYGWPLHYTTADLNRPLVNIRLGSYYFETWLRYYQGDAFAALAAYNGGPGNTEVWITLAKGDPDLFLETIRSDETQNYIKRIAEFHEIYKSFYTH